jgi:chromosome segregation ATPase
MYHMPESLVRSLCLAQPGPDAFEVVPDSQLVVTRSASKNNSSRYTINRRTSTFTEVQTLLKGRGIDLDHKRFLILQVREISSPCFLRHLNFY